MKVGYARVSTEDQKHDRQVASLEAAGCTRIVTEVVSGPAEHKPRLDALIEELGPGDQLVVHELDRVARSTMRFLEVVSRLEERGASLCVLSPALDLSGPIGKAIATIMATFAELEFHTAKKRQREGIARAKEAGRYKGRRRALNAEQRKAVREMRAEGRSIRELARLFKVGNATISRTLDSSN